MNPYWTLCDHTYQKQLKFPPQPDPHQPELQQKSRYQVLVMAPSEVRKAQTPCQWQPLLLQDLLLPLVNQIWSTIYPMESVLKYSSYQRHSLVFISDASTCSIRTWVSLHINKTCNAAFYFSHNLRLCLPWSIATSSSLEVIDSSTSSSALDLKHNLPRGISNQVFQLPMA